MHRTAAVPVRLDLEQAIGAVAIVVPAGMAEDGVEADALDWNAAPERLAHLSADVAQPGCAQVILDARLGQEERAVVAGVDGRQQGVQWARARVEGRERLTFA